MSVSKSTGLAYSWREICVKNLLKVFTETRLEDERKNPFEAKIYLNVSFQLL